MRVTDAEAPPVAPSDAPVSVTVHVRTRWDDCDRHGHVNNAAYLALLREALERADPERKLGRLAEVDIAYRSPLPPGRVVAVRVHVEDEREGAVHAALELALDGCVAATARARWGGTPRPLPALVRDLGGRAFAFGHEVRPYELGPGALLRPMVALQWFEHAVYRAAQRVGWTIERMREADFLTLQIGHHLVLGADADIGERITIASRLVEMRRVSGTWHHEARRSDGALVAADRSRGAFVDLAGTVRPAPRDMIGALLRGEPA